MLIKYSLSALLIFGAVATVGNAQAPLWFDANDSGKAASTTATPAHTQDASQSTPGSAPQEALWFKAAPWDAKWERKQAPELKPSTVPNWVEANKISARSQATSLPEPASTVPAQTGSLKNESRQPTTVAPTTWFSLAEAIKAQAKTPANAGRATAKVEDALKITDKHTGSKVAGKSESADTFVARAEAQLRLQNTAPKQVPAPTLPSPNQPALTVPARDLPSSDTLSASGALRRVTEAKVSAPQVPEVVFGREDSTRLKPRALQSGEMETGSHWPRQFPETSPAAEVATVTVSSVEAATEESLVPAIQTAAVWQMDDDEESVGGTMRETSVEEVPGAVMKGTQKPAKFETESMVGPMTSAGQLFSMLDLTERFQSYAEPVGSVRTRDLDSPMQAPYTFENYTWISPVFYHKPLYFEQPNLERYGQGAHRYLQPAASSIHFFGTIPLLPYKVLTQHPCEKYYTLGNRRPGNCNPYQRRVILGQSTVGEIREYWRDGSGY